MARTMVSTDGAPAPVGAYSQAVRVDSTVYISGQLALDPATREFVTGDAETQVRRIFENLKAIAAAAGGTLDMAARMTVYLVDFAHFSAVNKVMAEFIAKPYPARVAIGVASLPRGATVEVDCILALPADLDLSGVS